MFLLSLIKYISVLSQENYEDNEVLGCLEEMGLSKYESTAYYNLLGKGMISASEVAYCSNLPRTKIYFILKKMEKKKLVLINYQKPLLARAIPPNEAFSKTLSNFENKISSIKKTIHRLQQINDNGLKNKGIEEKKYFLLNQFSTHNNITNLVKNTKESIDITINSWGSSLLKITKDEIMQAILRDVKIRIVFDTGCERENIILPAAIEKRYSKTNMNMFIFDNSLVLIINNDGTKSALLHANEVFLPILINLFKESWKSFEKIVIEN